METNDLRKALRIDYRYHRRQLSIFKSGRLYTRSSLSTSSSIFNIARIPPLQSSGASNIYSGAIVACPLSIIAARKLYSRGPAGGA